MSKILWKAGVFDMDQALFEVIAQKAKELIEAPTCSAEAKAAAQRWLDAVGTDGERAETEQFIKELEADIMPIDSLIGFAESAKGVQYFGADTAAGIVAHAKEIKAAGAQYCDCPACAIVAQILEHKAELLR
jgi:hypothetical protein